MASSAELVEFTTIETGACLILLRTAYKLFTSPQYSLDSSSLEYCLIIRLFQSSFILTTLLATVTLQGAACLSYRMHTSSLVPVSCAR